MMPACLLPLLAVTDRLLDPEVIKSLTMFNFPPVVTVSLAAIAASIAVGYLLQKGLRLKDYGWRFGLILAAWTASISVILFGQFKLGADLRGGVNLVYEVDDAKTKLLNPSGQGDAYDLDAVVSVLRRRLNPSGLRELVIRKSGPKQIEIVVPEVDKAQIDDIKKRIRTGGALRFLIVANDPTKDGHIIDAAKAQAALPDSDPNKRALTVKDEEKTDIGYWVKVAREDEKKADSPFRDSAVHQDVLRDARTGDLIALTPSEDAEVRENPARLSKLLAARGIREVEVLLRAPDSAEVDVRGEDLAHANPSLQMEGWEIDFVMKGLGIGKMGALTGQNLAPPERYLGIVFDNELLSAPAIKSQITEQGRITGRFSEQEVRFMSEILKSGSMPVVLSETPIAENLIGSILGMDTIIKGSWSVVVSLLVVLVVVGVYYRFAGIVACLALILNLLLTVAIMIVIQAPFTLPGLAGLVLTVGMSIDANVLIFERFREEVARGAALRMALRNGFDRAMATIIDSNLTTLLTAVVLYVIGTDQLRGFGVTVSLGIITSMFTAIFCARTIFETGERMRWLTSLSMTQFLTNPKVDWVKLFVPTTVASVVLILIGLVATVARGTGIFDIDLKGGTTVTPMLRVPMKDAEVRQALAKQFASLTDTETGGRVDYQVYEISLQGEPAGSVYKIDSSIPSVDDLQKHVQQALRDPQTGADRIRTYQLEYKLVSTSKPEPAAQGEPSSDAAPTDRGAKPASAGSSPQAELPRGTSGKAAAPEGSADCGQPAAGAKSEGEKTDATSAEEKNSEATAAESKGAPAKSDATKEESKTPEEPIVTAPQNSPAVSPTAGADKPPAAGLETTFEVRFPQNKINAYALTEHINAAAKKVLNQDPFAVVTNAQWSGRDNTAFETWTVKLALSEENAHKVLADLEQTMETSPVWQNASSVSGQVTLDMQLKALYAILVSLMGIAAYVWFRFQKLSWGIAAVVSLLHDTLVMLAGIALSYYVASAMGFLLIQEFKISLTVVAGFLTLIGYSINDTIVIFDRIREIRGKSQQFTGEMINDSVNQTLSRTILTGGLTLLVVLILYIWGGEGIHTFAFCMLIGVISGTYSTVFIAAPLLLWLMGTGSTTTQSAKPAIAKQPVATGGRT